MEKCMGIRTKEEIQNYKSQRDIIETQIANAEKKVTDYNSEIQKSEYQLQDAKAKLQALQSKLIEQKKVGDADISLTTQNMCRQQKYINDCEIYTHELRKNLNLVNQAIKCCEKERDKFNELITTSENIRKHYKQDEDYLEAKKNLNDAEAHLKFLKERLQKIRDTIDWCETKTKTNNSWKRWNSRRVL